MIGYFGDIIFETSDKKILTFKDFKRTIGANYSEHERIGKKSRLEFNRPENQEVTFKMKIIAGYGVKPWEMLHKLVVACEKGEVIRSEAEISSLQNWVRNTITYGTAVNLWAFRLMFL